ncbi:MAG: hydroxymethylglutaryl-CoA lyase, partial [Flavobacteriales bacterium]
MKIIECPRDAMQGIKDFIPTAQKVAYLNSLLKVGFDTLDFGSFVSPKAIPQMRDTANVLSQLDDSNTRLLAIVANQRGADEACSFDRIDYLGYPFSVSENFQKRNTNKSIDQSLSLVEQLQNTCVKHHKSLVVYMSMAFGNPYGEHWHEDIVAKWGEKLSDLGVKIIALSDTIGVSNPDNIKPLFSLLIEEYPQIEWGAHLHTHLESWREKVEVAYNSGCRRFDGAIKGYGGCPMAKDDLVGNMPTE